jgi:hypothetical protein
MFLKVENQGRIFGIFKTNYVITAKMNIETQEIYDIKKPWWSFLVFSR